MMKRNFKYIVLLAFMALIVLPGCEMSDRDDRLVHEGQKELRTVAGEFVEQLDRMMATPAMTALNLLGEFCGVNRIPFSENGAGNADPVAMRQLAMVNHLLTHPYELPLPGNLVILEVARHSAKKNFELPVPGIYQYNFNTGKFDMLNPFVDHFEFRFPSCLKKRQEKVRDAIFRFERLTTEEVTKDCGAISEVPASLDAVMLINDEEVMRATYRISLAANGKPLMTSIQLDTPPYSMNLHYSGSGNSFSLAGTVKEEDRMLIGINLGMSYCAREGVIQNANGLVLLGSAKIDGNIQPIEIGDCNFNLDEMNRFLSANIRKQAGNKIIGSIEFRMNRDTRLNADLPELAIVYGDGTYEFLADVLEEILKK
jgi:hypothetical protein